MLLTGITFLINSACENTWKSAFTGRHCYQNWIQGHHHNDNKATWRPHILCSINGHRFLDLKKPVKWFTAPLRDSPTSSYMHFMTVFIDLQPFGWNLKWGCSELQQGLGELEDEDSHSIVCPVPISFRISRISFIPASTNNFTYWYGNNF